MKIAPAFITMLALAAVGAVAVVRLMPSSVTQPDVVRVDGAPLASATPAVRSLVLAGHPATYALAHALVAGTAVEVMSGWPAGTPWAEQAEFARQPSSDWTAKARAAMAVVTLRQHARGDALFAAVRAVNPRVVEIDASVLGDRRTPSVRLRAGGEGGPAFALSPTNAIRIAERIAADLTALQPKEAAVLAENLRATKERLLRLKAKFEKEFALLAAPEVVVFSGDFDYLCEDFGLQVVERFEADFGRLSPEQQAASLERLQRSGTRVSLHPYAPTPALAEVLARAQVTPVVLEPLTRGAGGVDDFFAIVESDLTALHAALRAVR